MCWSVVPMASGCTPEKLALKLEPPTLMMQYRDVSGKRRTRTVKLTADLAQADPEKVVGKICKSIPLASENAKLKNQVRRLVAKLQEHTRKETNLNKLGDEEVAAAKAAMDVEFEKNRKRPDDPDFVYDVQVDFEPADDLGNSWDDD